MVTRLDRKQGSSDPRWSGTRSIRRRFAGPGGYWNEDPLPVTDWEVPAERVVLPEHLQHRLGGGVPAVLRWDEEKFNLVMSKHKRDRDVILKLTQRLDGWRYLGKERGSPNLRALFQDEQERWYSLTVGELQGSYNVVTVFGGSDKRFLDKRLRGIEEVVRSG